MLNIDLIFIPNTVMDKCILKCKVFDDRWRNILHIVFVIEIVGHPAMKQPFSVTVFQNWVHVLLVGLVAKP